VYDWLLLARGWQRAICLVKTLASQCEFHLWDIINRQQEQLTSWHLSSSFRLIDLIWRAKPSRTRLAVSNIRLTRDMTCLCRNWDLNVVRSGAWIWYINYSLSSLLEGCELSVSRFRFPFYTGKTLLVSATTVVDMVMKRESITQLHYKIKRYFGSWVCFRHNLKKKKEKRTRLYPLGPVRYGYSRSCSFWSSLRCCFFLNSGLCGCWHCCHSWPIVPASGDSEDDCGEADGI
jgi:hypothetical protein